MIASSQCAAGLQQPRARLDSGAFQITNATNWTPDHVDPSGLGEDGHGFLRRLALLPGAPRNPGCTASSSATTSVVSGRETPTAPGGFLCDKRKTAYGNLRINGRQVSAPS